MVPQMNRLTRGEDYLFMQDGVYCSSSRTIDVIQLKMSKQCLSKKILFLFYKIMQNVGKEVENAPYLIEVSNLEQKLSLSNRIRPSTQSPMKPRIRVFPLTSPDF